MTIFSLLRSVAGTQLKLVLAAILLSSLAASQAVVIEWDANQETNVRDYRIFVSNISRSNSPPGSAVYTCIGTNAGVSNTVFVVTNLVNGTNWFVVTARDTDGLESDFSDEVFSVNNTNRPTQVKGVRLRKLFVQSAPSVMGPWSQGAELTQVETADGSQFYRLAWGEPAPPMRMIPKRFLSVPAPKSGKLLPAPKTPYVIPPPPTPPK